MMEVLYDDRRLTTARVSAEKSGLLWRARWADQVDQKVQIAGFGRTRDEARLDLVQWTDQLANMTPESSTRAIFQ